jgi:hypothetical protein
MVLRLLGYLVVLNSRLRDSSTLQSLHRDLAQTMMETRGRFASIDKRRMRDDCVHSEGDQVARRLE